MSLLLPQRQWRDLEHFSKNRSRKKAETFNSKGAQFVRFFDVGC